MLRFKHYDGCVMKTECSTCGHIGEPKIKGNIIITIILLFFGLLPGILYEIWRRSGGKVCSNCGSLNIKYVGRYQPAKNKPMNIKAMGIIIAICALSFVSLFFMKPSDNAIHEEKPTQKQNAVQRANNTTNPQQKIDSNAYGTYTSSSYPKLYAMVGQAGLDAIATHDINASLAVARRDDCDKVVYVGYSDKTIYPSKLVSFVDCANGKRFYVSNGIVE